MHMDDFLFAGGFFVFVLGGLLLLALFIAALVSIANHRMRAARKGSGFSSRWSSRSWGQFCGS